MTRPEPSPNEPSPRPFRSALIWAVVAVVLAVVLAVLAAQPDNPRSGFYWLAAALAALAAGVHGWSAFQAYRRRPPADPKSS